LLLPEGIANRLTHAQLRAILAHEMCHVRRRDNLAAALHMVVEALFWFHPLVWWIGARLVEERERACDEEVLRLGAEPLAYAEGILNVCKFYLESPLPCAAGVTGADLKKRIEDIMSNCLSRRLTPAKKILLAAAALLAVAGPVVMGVVKAQTPATGLVFEVATVKKADPNGDGGVRLNFLPGGALRATNFPLRELISFAYDVRDFQVKGPSWIENERYDIMAKPEKPGPDNLGQMSPEERKSFGDQMRERTRALLAERFRLVTHRESTEMPVYALVVAKGGPKMQEAQPGGPGNMRGMRGQINAQNTTMEMLAGSLSRMVGRVVVDRTGLTKSYDFVLEWTPDSQGPPPPGGRPDGPAPADVSGPSIFTALQEKLGLRLESTKAPVPIIVVDRVERPSEN
jgi:uncharacterized protein (TIGR03435 family)